MLSVTEHAEGVWTVQDFLSQAECNHWIAYCEEQGFEITKIGPGKRQELNLTVRNNERYIHDSEKLAQEMYARISPYAPAEAGGMVLSGLNSRFRFYKYQPGQRFRMHQDEAYYKNTNEWSALTFMVYLNGEMEGGATGFLRCRIQPRTGMALLFQHRLMHEGEEIRAGVKYVMRSDVVYRRR